MPRRPNFRNEPHRRPSHNPSRPYRRPVRDKILRTCTLEQRTVTEAERHEIINEVHMLAKCGYDLLGMFDEDKALISRLLPKTNHDDDDGSDQLTHQFRPDF